MARFLSLRWMAVALGLVAVCGALWIGGGVPAHAAQASVVVSISTPSSTFRAGDDVPVSVYFWNQSPSPKWIMRSKATYLGEMTNTVTVTRDDGSLVPKTEYGRALNTIRRKGPRPKNFTVEVMPGGSIQVSVVINKLFDISRPGQYLVKVEHPLTEGEMLGVSDRCGSNCGEVQSVLSSNVIAVRILP